MEASLSPKPEGVTGSTAAAEVFSALPIEATAFVRAAVSASPPPTATATACTTASNCCCAENTACPIAASSALPASIAATGSKASMSTLCGRPSAVFSSASLNSGLSASTSVRGETTFTVGSPEAISRPTLLPVSMSVPPSSTTMRPLALGVTPSSEKLPFSSVTVETSPASSTPSASAS